MELILMRSTNERYAETNDSSPFWQGWRCVDFASSEELDLLEMEWRLDRKGLASTLSAQTTDHGRAITLQSNIMQINFHSGHQRGSFCEE